MKRVFVLFLYYLSSLKRNKGRLFDLFLWPIVETIVFGFTASYFKSGTIGGGNRILAVLLGSIIFWHFFSRISIEIYHQLFDEVLSRNLQNIFLSPIKSSEIIGALLLSGIFKLLLSASLVYITALVVFKFNLFSITSYAPLIIVILILWGASVSLFISSFLFVLGNKAWTLGMLISVFIQPFSCVFYPVSVLPGYLRNVAYLVPASYLFELYRKQISGMGITFGDFLVPLVLTIVYFFISIKVFMLFLKMSRVSGMLVKL